MSQYQSHIDSRNLIYDGQTRILKAANENDQYSDEIHEIIKGKVYVQPKEKQTNLYGCAILVILGLSSLFYMGLRIYSILSMDEHIWFAIYSLIGEATLISSNVWYCLYLMFQLKPINHCVIKDESELILKRKYTIYVLIPCYKEGLDVITKTITSILRAREGFVSIDILIYLCDDGNDPLKKDYIQKDLQCEYGVFYIDGRVKPSNQINGKSENINNALQNHIFKHNNRWEDPNKISLGEMICIFDADQCPHEDFFKTMIPRMNISDDIALVLSPQKFNNVDPWSDIFNHYNIHFWHYIMSSLCSFDTIFCTGTNFLLRARALAQVGWFPTKSITEDFELGIYLTINKWKYEYIYEYLAVGDAPTGIRNIYQQRSRWSKGAFQILWRKPSENPFCAPGLSLYQRMLYVCGLYSYFADFVSTPILFSIPILAIWLKVFPYIITKTLVITLTVMAFTTKLTGIYANNLKNMMLMQYAVICHYLMWYVYFKAFWRTLIMSITGRSLSFKATKKNESKSKFNMESLSLQDTWVFIVMWLISVATLCFVFLKGILYQRYIDGEINLPFWAFYYLPNMYKLDQYDVIDILWCSLNLSLISMLFLYMIFKDNRTMMRILSFSCVAQQVIVPVVFLILLWDLTNKDFVTERSKIPNGKSKLYKLDNQALLKSDDVLSGLSMDLYNQFDITYQQYIDKTETSFAVRQIFVKFPFQLFDTNEDEKMSIFLTECAEQQLVCTISLEPFKGLNSYTTKEVYQLANRFKIFGIPIILRFAHEMNSNWYPWSQQPLLFKQRFEEMSEIMKKRAPNVGMMISYQETLGYPFVAPGSEFYPKNNTDETMREYREQDTNNDGLITSDDDGYMPFTPNIDSFEYVGGSMYWWGQAIGAVPSFNIVPQMGYAYTRLFDIHAMAKKWDKQFIISEQGALYIDGNQRRLTPQMVRRGFEQVDEVRIKQEWIEQIYLDLPRQFSNLKQIYQFEFKKLEGYHKDSCLFYKPTIFRNVNCEDDLQSTIDWTISLNPEVTEVFNEIVTNNNDIVKGDIKQKYFIELPMNQ